MQEQKGGNSSPNEAADVPVAGNQECMAVLCSTWLLRRGEERETFRRMEKGRTEGRGVEIRAEKGKGLEKYGKGKIRRERGGRDRKGRKKKHKLSEPPAAHTWMQPKATSSVSSVRSACASAYLARRASRRRLDSTIAAPFSLNRQLLAAHPRSLLRLNPSVVLCVYSQKPPKQPNTAPQKWAC